MKQFICIFLSVAMLLSAAPAFADSASSFDNAGYFITAITEIHTDVSEKGEYYTTQSKSTTYYLSGVAQWSFTVTGTFRYNNITSTCISADRSNNIHVTGWSCTSSSAYPSGNQAIGSATFVRKVLGITVQTVPVSLTITCDKDGNIS